MPWDLCISIPSRNGLSPRHSHDTSSAQMSPYQRHLPFHQHRVSSGISLVVQWLGLNGVPNAGGPGVIPGQGIRSHMLQVRVSLSQLKSLRAATKTRHGRIHFFFFLKQVLPPLIHSPILKTSSYSASSPKPFLPPYLYAYYLSSHH